MVEVIRGDDEARPQSSVQPEHSCSRRVLRSHGSELGRGDD